MNEFALTGNPLCPAVAEAEETFHMDEERFRAFYERTARPLWCFLSRLTGDPSAADDLVQETYYRFLRVKLPEMGEAQRKSYLFRIASNLVRDDWRRRKIEPPLVADETEAVEAPAAHPAEQIEHRAALRMALQRLKPNEREMLWLAYVEGSSHKEISEVSGVKLNSVRPLLLRARRKLATVLRRAGVHHR